MKTTPRYTHRRSILAVGLLLLGLGVSAWAQSSNVTVFATGFEFPRGLIFGPDGNLYVAEAGAGGNMSTIGDCEQADVPYTGGFTGRISMVTPSAVVSTVADNLPSTVDPDGDVLGPSQVGFIRDHLYFLDVAGCSHGFLNNDSAILRINKDGSSTLVADLSEFQMAHPVQNPPPDFEPDGTWFGMTIVGNLIFPMDSNHGELDRVHTNGKIGRLADFSVTPGHIVPTAVVYDGVNFLVGNLGTFPIVDGAEFIMKVSPSGKTKTVATGLTTILGLAYDNNKNLYAVENTTGGNPFPTPGTGKIVRVNRDGTLTEIATGLNLPTGITFGPDGNFYVSAWGFGPPGMGEIDKVTLP
jgi:hypothetical protein